MRRNPSAAMTLLRDRDLVEWAADPVENPAWSRARATTKDAKDKVVADFMASSGDADLWADQLHRLVQLQPEELEAVLAHEPTKRVEIRRDGKSPRPIGVPTFLRRLLSIHVGNVLTTTSEAVLPPTVVAYRRNHEDAVVEAVMAVSMAVQAANGTLPERFNKPKRIGVRYFAKLDLQGFFSSIPRTLIEAALEHYRYTEDFTEVVMAMVNAPVVRRRKGKNVKIKSKKGTEQGMAESSAIANLVPFALDECFSQRGKTLLYVRYCDDIFIGGVTRSDVVGGVRAVQRWARKAGIGIKGVSPNQNPDTLVYDVKNRRIELLGAEVNANGTIRMPIAKLKAKLAQLRDIESRRQSGVINGVSVMAGGKGTRATDADDFACVREGFLLHWSKLNKCEADRADALITKTFPLACSPRSGTPGAVWSARLWADQTDTGRGLPPSVHHPRPLQLCPMPEAPPGPESDGGDSGVLDTESFTLNEAKVAETERSLRLYTENSVFGVGFDDEGAHPFEVESGFSHGDWAVRPLTLGDVDDAERCPDEDREEEGDDSPLSTHGRESYRFERQLLENLRQLEEEFSQGSVASPRAGQHPPPEVPAEIVLVAARRVKSDSRVTLTPSSLEDGMYVRTGDPVALTVRGRPEAAIVLAITENVRGLPPGAIVTFGLGSAFLPKLLLRRDRGPRSPLLYARLRELHEAARVGDVRVTLVGPLPRRPSDKSPLPADSQAR